MSGDSMGFSFIRLALLSLGAGLAVLVVSLPLIWAASQVHRWLALAVAVLAIIGIVAAIGIVANRVVSNVAQRLKQAHDDPPPLDPHHG